jgi:hypothetical protein
VKNTLIYVLAGAAAGLLVAQCLPALGKSGLDRGLSNLAFNLGAQKPYAVDGCVGAGLGLLAGLLRGK